MVARIPRGRVATYGQVARQAGIPGAARTVGWAMASLPESVRIGGRPVPWHRVINARGRISPRGAASADGDARQALRLRREGVEVAPGGAVDLASYAWDGRGGAPSGRARGAPGSRSRAARANCSS